MPQPQINTDVDVEAARRLGITQRATTARRYEVVNAETGAVVGEAFMEEDAAGVKASYLNNNTRILHILRGRDR